MSSREYLGLVSYEHALRRQEDARSALISGMPGRVLGFESKPVVTLGIRGGPGDLICADLASRGFTVLTVDRGGQATLHNPGQLVIFPVFDAKALGGVKAWVCLLVRATQLLARGFGQQLEWDSAQPGLYDSSGRKVVSVGVRLVNGVSTHGVAINLSNDLTPFAWIRTCGKVGAGMAHLSTDCGLPEAFQLWCEAFDAEVDKTMKLAQVRELVADARS